METGQDWRRQLLTRRHGAGWAFDTGPLLPPELPAPFCHDPIRREPGEPPFVRQQAAVCVRSRPKTHSKTKSSSDSHLRQEGKSSRDPELLWKCEPCTGNLEAAKGK